jgi:hypothetical protein
MPYRVVALPAAIISCLVPAQIAAQRRFFGNGVSVSRRRLVGRQLRLIVKKSRFPLA